MGKEAFLHFLHHFFLDVWVDLDRELDAGEEAPVLWLTPMNQQGVALPAPTIAVDYGDWTQTASGVANTNALAFAGVAGETAVAVIVHRPRAADTISTKVPTDDNTIGVAYLPAPVKLDDGLSLAAGALTLDYIPSAGRQTVVAT